MLRVVAKHVILADLDAPERTCQWLREVAVGEGVEGWVAPKDAGLEAWFEGSTSAVDAMLAWCESQRGKPDAPMHISTQRPCLCGGFELLEQAPT
jgi:hypothetical protein